MQMERLAAQLLWCGWGEAPEPDPKSYNDHARYLAEGLGVGGLVLFTRNLGTPDEIAALVGTLRAHSATPLLIGIDQEGGRVSRLPLPGMVFPGNMALGKLDRPEATRQVHRALGEQLAALGIDVDFAPSLDVNNNPANPIIGVRSFGEDPGLVARHGVEAVAGFREAGVLPVVKHFPGHGDTQADSHLELPCQPADRARLESVELVPFRAALAEPALAVMTTHILFPALDPELPSTLSPRILSGLLRDELGFDGLVVTDCLEMKGIASHWSPEETAVLAIEAGADMLLVCHTRETQARMHAALCRAVREGRLTEERLAQSVTRIDRARAATAGVRAATPDPSRAGSEPYRVLEARLARESLQYWNDGRYTPAVAPPPGWNPAGPVLVAGAAGVAESLAQQLRDIGCAAEAVAGDAAGRKRLAEAPQMIWTVLPQDPFPGGRPAPEAAELLARHPRAAVIALREPYCLAHYPEAAVRLAAWGSQPVHLRAVAGWLVGEPAP